MGRIGCLFQKLVFKIPGVKISKQSTLQNFRNVRNFLRFLIFKNVLKKVCHSTFFDNFDRRRKSRVPLLCMSQADRPPTGSAPFDRNSTGKVWTAIRQDGTASMNTCGMTNSINIERHAEPTIQPATVPSKSRCAMVGAGFVVRVDDANDKSSVSINAESKNGPL